LFSIDQVPQSLLKTPLSSGGPAVLLVDGGVLTGNSDYRELATDGVNVYFPTAQAILSVPVGGGSPTQVIATPQPRDLKLDSTYPYWISGVSILQIPTQ
jgi:hypothetical protein